MLAWLRRRRTPLMRSSEELAKLLRGAAVVAADPAIAEEYRTSADALDRVAALTRRHSDAPTADALQWALGRVELNVNEHQVELFDLLKAQHALLKDQGAAVAELRADFHTTAESLDDWRQATDDRLESFERRMSTSERDRGSIHAELREAQEERQQLIGQLDKLTTDFMAFRERIEQLISQALPPEQVAGYIEMIERHEQALRARDQEAGA